MCYHREGGPILTELFAEFEMSILAGRRFSLPIASFSCVHGGCFTLFRLLHLMLETVVLATRSYALMVELADASLFCTGNTKCIIMIYMMHLVHRVKLLETRECIGISPMHLVHLVKSIFDALMHPRTGNSNTGVVWMHQCIRA